MLVTANFARCALRLGVRPVSHRLAVSEHSLMGHALCPPSNPLYRDFPVTGLKSRNVGLSALRSGRIWFWVA